MSTSLKITVIGMKCGGCEKTIIEKLTTEEGVVSVTADHSADLVEVVFDAAIIEEDAILDCIEEAGFSVAD